MDMADSCSDRRPYDVRVMVELLSAISRIYREISRYMYARDTAIGADSYADFKKSISVISLRTGKVLHSEQEQVRFLSMRSMTLLSRAYRFFHRNSMD